MSPSLSPIQPADARCALGSSTLPRLGYDAHARSDGRREAARFPSRAAVGEVVELLAGALFPRRLRRFRGSVAEDARAPLTGRTA